MPQKAMDTRVSHVSVACTSKPYIYPLHVQLACVRQSMLQKAMDTHDDHGDLELIEVQLLSCMHARTHARTHAHAYTHTHTHTARTQVQKLYSDSFHVDELTELREEYLAMRENDSSMLSLSQVMHAHIHEIIQARGPHVPPCACVSDACV